MNTDKSEKRIKELFIGKCWEYLNNNFSKFSETNQIKIALELCKKDIPQEMTGNLNVTQMPTIQKNGEAQPSVKLEFNIGSPHTPINSQHTGQAPTVN